MPNSRLSAFLADDEVQAVFKAERERLTRAAMHAKHHEESRDAWLQYNALRSVEQALQRTAGEHKDE